MKLKDKMPTQKFPKIVNSRNFIRAATIAGLLGLGGILSYSVHQNDRQAQRQAKSYEGVEELVISEDVPIQQNPEFYIQLLKQKYSFLEDNPYVDSVFKDLNRNTKFKPGEAVLLPVYKKSVTYLSE